MPTGLMVSETTETSITWTWNAVDGATGYAVQVSSDEMFGDDDDVHNTEETTYTASDLDPSTSVYVRVAATLGRGNERLHDARDGDVGDAAATSATGSAG